MKHYDKDMTRSHKNKARAKEYNKKYNSRPENKAKRKKVRDRPENKAREKARRQTDEYKKKAKLRKLTPENKAKTNNRNRNNNIRFTKEKLKYGNICTCCGLTDIHNLTKDHIIPLSKGGTDTPDNIQLHCFACNCSKGDRLKCTLPHDQEFYDLI